MGTEKIYDADAYTRVFEARALSCEPCEGGFAVTLDRTAFFPEAGGQTPDTGKLNGARVKNVTIDEETDIITHTVDSPIEVGAEVSGEIDWERRFDNMQQHTGEHIFSGIVCSRFNCNNVGFHLGRDTMTMDYDRALSLDELIAVETDANRVIWADIPVEARYPGADELSALNYRSKKEIRGAVRIVTIPDIDVCACCAPHVRRTGEVGLCKLWSVEAHKGGVRVTVFCGERALRLLSREHDILTGIAKELSTSVEEVPSNFEKTRLMLSEARRRESDLVRRATEAALRTQDIIFEGESDFGAMRRSLDDWLKDGEGIKYIFSGDGDGGFRFLVGRGRRSSDDTKSLADTLAVLKDRLGAKGGGGPDMAQGSVRADKDDILKALRA